MEWNVYLLLWLCKLQLVQESNLRNKMDEEDFPIFSNILQSDCWPIPGRVRTPIIEYEDQTVISSNQKPLIIELAANRYPLNQQDKIKICGYRSDTREDYLNNEEESNENYVGTL